MNLSLRSFEKLAKLSADNFKKVLDLDGSTSEPAIPSGDSGQRIPCRSVGRSVYGHVITKFSGMGRFP